MSVTVEPPQSIPGVDHLSVSSIRTYLTCPEAWRRRYLEREYEPSSPALILGSAVGHAAGQNYSQKIDSKEDMPEADLLDLYAGEFDYKQDTEEIVWGDVKPGEVKDSGAKVLAVYHTLTAPQVQPISVEREFEMSWEGLDWTFTGALDFEEVDGDVSDIKTKSRSMNQLDADTDFQASMYLVARRAEGNPAKRFGFHQMVKVKNPEAKHVTPVYTSRTDTQLDFVEHRVFQVAAEMAWRIESDNWGYAVPGSWKCSERYCGYWSTCPAGGLR